MLRDISVPDLKITRIFAELHPQYVSQFEVEDASRLAIHARLENTPLRLINTSTCADQRIYGE
ncbi:uncharacterized protein F5891DRAFT_1034166 [Suillus fuscotomentosus]|uniref:Uncharacterized protein n=1 Tax=Suillus fuscotomentosus TaxID=1912939 RepID=A0AAD4E8N3_9AGAM|nr:uncharacterized protein F5891DRAFT_1034166 [Suillus fuscotomentosus]KAG1900454.1 hypothetical protein F5891DRAFT_1034166 [Suillus fuscotomentosus]